MLKLDLKAGIICSIEGIKFLPEIFINKNLLGIYVDKDSNDALARLDLSTNEMHKLVEEPFRLWGKNDNHVFGVKIGKGHELFSINALRGSINWNIDFRTELSGKIFLQKKIILVVGNSYLFAVNAEDGQILWQIEANNLLQPYEDRIVNVDATHYREILFSTGEMVVEYQMESEYKKHNFRFMGTNSRFTITETHVLIVDAIGSSFGCINRKTGMIDWSVQVGEGKVTLPHAPIVYENKLYILDDEGTLHAYERVA